MIKFYFSSLIAVLFMIEGISLWTLSPLGLRFQLASGAMAFFAVGFLVVALRAKREVERRDYEKRN